VCSCDCGDNTTTAVCATVFYIIQSPDALTKVMEEL
jgi:hypothetical protein